jgi:iron-sulfur cluster repair protein YtfE (RIC family)
MDKHPVNAYFEDDHDRLDGLFRDFQSLKRTDPEKAKASFREFKFGLQRHIIWEEEILFPIFESKTGLASGGPTEVMRREHREIGSILESIHEKVRAGNPESDDEEAGLLGILGLHNEKEERILYPAIGRSLGPGEGEKVFEAMRTIPEARYETCCNQHPPKNS